MYHFAKPISGKRYSLYLDFYPVVVNSENGEKIRRILGLYMSLITQGIHWTKRTILTL
jgi:hypothetical protein